jgi:hypothetical protein
LIGELSPLIFSITVDRYVVWNLSLRSDDNTNTEEGQMGWEKAERIERGCWGEWI